MGVQERSQNSNHWMYTQRKGRGSTTTNTIYIIPLNKIKVYVYLFFFIPHIPHFFQIAELINQLL